LDEKEFNTERRPANTSATAVSRREYIKTALGAVSMFAAGAAVIPLYKFVASPALDAMAGEYQTRITVSGGAALARGDSLIFAFNGSPAVLIHHDDDNWSCFRAVCTHMACTVKYNKIERHIVCACHKGVFDSSSGLPIQGPPTRALEKFKVELDNGEIIVSVG
jgi:cytochrome b6-f complex iron-sulfur subunit